MTLVNHVTSDASGGLHTHVVIILHGTGVGTVSGNKYVFNSAFSDIPLNVPSSGTVITSSVGHFNLIGQGSVPNFSSRVVMHFSTNSNGEVTATVDNFSVDCGG